jgi:flagellar biosynthetic protein FlhB
MHEQDDHESRTQEASEKKIRDTIEKGKLPVSKDAGVAALFVSFLLCLTLVIPQLWQRLITTLAAMLGRAGELPLLNGADAASYTSVVAIEMALFVGPMVGLISLGGLVASFAQGVPRIVTDRIMPDFSRISIAGGLNRLVSLSNVVEFLKAVFKIAIVGGVIAFVLISDRDALTGSMKMEPRLIPQITLTVVEHLTSAFCIVVGLLALADLGWVRFKWRQDLRMSRQELKDEHKESEGDPHVRSRLRSIALDRSRKRMMSAVPRATFVIANPTHYAIALRYVRAEGGAPLVVAKGKDLIALKIREIAEQNGIPVLERKDLVRAMFDHVELDRMIPQEFFRSIAELIHFLSSLKSESARRSR